MDTPPPLGKGTVIGADFRIDRPLQAGGMGAVYVAEQLSTGKPRALKLMHPQLVSDPKSRQRFVEEARVGARIPSDHVVEVVGAGVDDATGMPYLAMELLEGEDLASVVERSGPLPAQSARELMLQLGHAIGAAHAQGIVHRDLKPENVFIAKSRRRGEQLTVKVLDFGIAKTLESSRTAATATAAMGSPLFMAPEQAIPGAPVRPATDVWALGLIAFNALAGVPYWRSAAIEPFSLQALLAEVLVHPIVPATQRAAELGAPGTLPAGFDAWFARCAAREAVHRFAEANACVEAFEAMLRGEVSDAGPQPLYAAAALAATAPLSSASGFGSAPGTPPYGGFGTPPPHGGYSSYGGATPPPRSGTVQLSQAETRSGGSLRWLPIAVGALIAMMVLTGAIVFGMYAVLRPEPTEPVAARASEPPPSADPGSPLDPLRPREEPPQQPPPDVDTGRTSPPESDPDPAPPSARRPPARDRPAAERLGQLDVSARPWATVYVDGRRIGNTPVVGHDLPAGTYTLALINPEVSGNYRRTVEIRDGQTTRISHTFPSGRSSERSIDELLDSNPPTRREPESGSSSLPANPSRSDVISAMNSVSGAVSACGQGQHGLAPVRVRFGSNGRVQSATVAGDSMPGPVRSCIARAVRGARVPPFRNDNFSVNYPFRL